MKTTITLLTLILLTILCSAQSRLTRQSVKPCLIVMADMDAIGDGKSTEDSELIIRQVTKDDPLPVFFVVNAGSSTLAQALYDFRKNHGPEEVASFVAKIRVMENGAQDNSDTWITHEFPDTK
jgi:hypothetical protein